VIHRDDIVRSERGKMKDSRPTVLSLFSGVGGFDMGLESAGMRTVYQCEIDKHCRSVLDRHWPSVPKWSDISTLTGDEILSHAPEIDVVAWGSPCQDLSVAGRRDGLGGTRSSLFHEGIRVINEIRKATNGRYPRISIWENVYGALTSNKGADFRVILAEMAKAGSILSEWRVLDAQFFGIPQRRRRVFVISVFDPAVADRCADEILPISASVRRDTKTSRSANEGASAETATGSARSDQSPILMDRAAFNQGVNAQYDPYISDDPVSPSLLVTPHAVAQQSESEVTLSFDTQFGSNANVTEDVAPTLKSSQQSPSVMLNTERTYRDVVGALLGRDCYGANTEGVRDGKLILESASALSMVVRRLTPVECERLMGWADDHTRYRADGSELVDGHRYRMCGNGVASPVARWIGEQIVPYL